MTFAQVTISAEVGGILAGIALVVTALASLANSRAANRKATEALAASPLAMFEGLRSEVEAVVDTYNEATKRWAADRQGMEDALSRERTRANAAEAVVLTLRGAMATMRIDLAAARAEVADLRTRFESAMAERHTQP